jgi:hypothetical protein
MTNHGKEFLLSAFWGNPKEAIARPIYLTASAESRDRRSVLMKTGSTPAFED